MRKWAIILVVLAVVLAGVFVVSISLWTRSSLYAASVADYCLPAKRMDRFRSGRVDPKTTLSQIVVGGQPRSFNRIERVEMQVVRRLGFFFVSREEQLSFIDQLPTCAPGTRDLVR